jgi:hypothetical protein
MPALRQDNPPEGTQLKTSLSNPCRAANSINYESGGRTFESLRARHLSNCTDSFIGIVSRMVVIWLSAEITENGCGFFANVDPANR